MKRYLIISLFLFVFSCSTAEKEEEGIWGKWYTYAESGDYMELWLSDDKAMSYLSGIDAFLLYDLERQGSTLKFDLIESKVIDEHQFQLQVTKSSDELFQSIFVSETKVDSLKTYFLVSKEAPDLHGSLDANRIHMEELFERLEGSHDGHDH